MTAPVATLNLVALREDRQINIVARIHAPQPVGDGGWSCAVEMAPVSDAVKVRGVDAFHALWLGCSLVLKVLANFRDEGWELAGEDGVPFPLDAYMAGLDAKPPA
ncbi:MAG TPA: hypothetical protein VD965_04225 [Burkholderiales bacterium]|nr:hypothetical protein [Burkholderiales bacterium]